MSKSSFFRQSGWMAFASGVFGLLMTAVHKIAKQMGHEEYSVFATLLLWISQLSVPALGLQYTFVQQTITDLDAGKRAALAGALRTLIAAVVAIWLLLAGVVFLVQDYLLTNYKIQNPAALWVAVATLLLSVLVPMLWGVLQGQQNFLWLGWATMLNGLLRMAGAAVAVLLLGWRAAGVMGGVLAGFVVAAGISIWQIRDLLGCAPSAFQWRPWLKRVVPITLGMGALTYLLTQDGIAVQRFFTADQSGQYAKVGIIGRALYFFTAPLTLVLFPKLVQSAVRSEKTSVLAQALGATFLMGSNAALVCTFFPRLPLWVLYDASDYPIAPLVPLFGWCVLPLTLSTVLVNNLLARQRFAVVPWVVAVAVGYGVSLHLRHDSFRQVIYTLGTFGSLLLIGCIFFTCWGRAGSYQTEGSRDTRDTR
ncbi:MAG TPA: hypothetical protein VNU68_32895 [Verrucomicrobiae bacterium]|nr:hypothetical protein [Verrucomicrobiae bacterium]